LALALSVVAGCEDKSNGTGPVTEGDFAAAAAAMEGVVDDYFTANEPAYRSIHFFGQRLAAALGGGVPAASGPASSAALLQSCLSPDVAGTTFDWDEGQGTYIPTAQTGAPADGARFLLYEVSGGTVVTPLNQIGYLDLDCPMTLPTVNLSLEVNIDGVQVLGMYATGNFNPSTYYYQLTVNVDLATPDGSAQFGIPALGVNGRLGGYHGSGYTMQVVSDVYAGFTRYDRTAEMEGFEVYTTLWKGLSTVEWDLNATLVGTSSSSIAGPAIFMFPIIDGHGGSIEIIACMSGSYVNMSVSSPTQACAEQELPLYQDMSNSELQAIERGYDALRFILDSLDGIVQIGLDVVTGSIG
jgi:hypothetical protein